MSPSYSYISRGISKEELVQIFVFLLGFCVGAEE